MIHDNYPTRLNPVAKFIPRQERVSYYKPMEFFFDEYENYKDNGYIHIPDFFKREAIKSCLQSSGVATGLETPEPGINAVRSITGLHEQEPFAGVSKNERMLSIVRSILGGDFYIHQSRINFKAGLGANGWYWHSDFETWHAQDGMPGMRCVSAMIPLTENSNCNGSLMVIPGSHRYFWSAPRPTKVFSAQENFADQKEGVPDTDALYEFFEKCDNRIEMITCKPGDLVLFDCNLIHVSTQNMSPLYRTNLFFVYNSIENQLLKPFSVDEPRPEMMGTREVKEIL